MSHTRDLEFLYELGTLRNMPRGWRQHLANDCASDLEHTMRVAWLAMLLGRMEGGVDENMILKMALVHDLAETRTSDLSYVQKVYVKADEEHAIHDMFAGTVFEDWVPNVVEVFEKRETLEAKIVKDADNLDIDLELKEMEEQGSQLPKKWQWSREMIRREKLYTDSARKIWDEIQTSDPSSWHLTANKWLKIPGAGR